ncbi:MAG TPA: hypothetical protein EYG91_02015 [Aquifex aeolicus]|nr:hypothetical protein [Aquifex aeolicus]
MLPLVALLASGIAAATGVATTLDALDNFSKAEEIVKKSKQELEKEKSILEKEANILREELELLGKLYYEILKDLDKFAKLVENDHLRLGRRINKSYQIFIKDVQVKYKKVSYGLVNAGKKGILTAALAYEGAVKFATVFGTASTGTAIASLSGVAYRNALLAWFGGGAVTAGGGGIALGSLVLGGIVAGSAAAVFGFSLNSKSQKALREAYKFRKKAKKTISELRTTRKLLKTWRKEAQIYRKALEQLRKEFNRTVFKLRIKKILRISSEKDFRNAYKLAMTLKEVIETPFIDEKKRSVNKKILRFIKIRRGVL